MANELIDEPALEIGGNRLTVYHLLPYFLDPTVTEAYICQLYKLTPEEVAACAYVLNNPDTVLERHLEIESRTAAGNPPEVAERAKQTHATFVKFKDWLANRRQNEAKENAIESAAESAQAAAGRFPTFREWLAKQESGTESRD